MRALHQAGSGAEGRNQPAPLLAMPDLNSDFRKDRLFQWLGISDRGLSTTPARLAAQAVG